MDQSLAELDEQREAAYLAFMVAYKREDEAWQQYGIYSTEGREATAIRQASDLAWHRATERWCSAMTKMLPA